MSGLSRPDLEVLLDCIDGFRPEFNLGVVAGYLADNSPVVIARPHAQLMLEHYASLADCELAEVGDLKQLFEHLVKKNRAIDEVSI